MEIKKINSLGINNINFSAKKNSDKNLYPVKSNALTQDTVSFSTKKSNNALLKAKRAMVRSVAAMSAALTLSTAMPTNVYASRPKDQYDKQAVEDVVYNYKLGAYQYDVDYDDNNVINKTDVSKIKTQVTKNNNAEKKLRKQEIDNNKKAAVAEKNALKKAKDEELKAIKNDPNLTKEQKKEEEKRIKAEKKEIDKEIKQIKKQASIDNKALTKEISSRNSEINKIAKSATNSTLYINGNLERFGDNKEAYTWLSASILALSQTEKGSQILSETITPLKGNKYQVNLKGTGETETFSTSAIKKELKRNNSLKGDHDAALIYLALKYSIGEKGDKLYPTIGQGIEALTGETTKAIKLGGAIEAQTKFFDSLASYDNLALTMYFYNQGSAKNVNGEDVTLGDKVWVINNINPESQEISMVNTADTGIVQTFKMNDLLKNQALLEYLNMSGLKDPTDLYNENLTYDYEGTLPNGEKFKIEGIKPNYEIKEMGEGKDKYWLAMPISLYGDLSKFTPKFDENKITVKEKEAKQEVDGKTYNYTYYEFRPATNTLLYSYEGTLPNGEKFKIEGIHPNYEIKEKGEDKDKYWLAMPISLYGDLSKFTPKFDENVISMKEVQAKQDVDGKTIEYTYYEFRPVTSGGETKKEYYLYEDEPENEPKISFELPKKYVVTKKYGRPFDEMQIRDSVYYEIGPELADDWIADFYPKVGKDYVATIDKDNYKYIIVPESSLFITRPEPEPTPTPPSDDDDFEGDDDNSVSDNNINPPKSDDDNSVSDNEVSPTPKPVDDFEDDEFEGDPEWLTLNIDDYNVIIPIEE